nr:uncharacterized protein LOC110374953 [Helicoverpa armigera]
MFVTTGIILCLTFVNVPVQIRCASESPAEDTYGIIETESAIRSTVNNLFSTLKIKEVQQGHKFKQFSKLHNFFVSVSLQDHDNLKEIARLTKVDNDNGTRVFIAQLNEVLKYDKDNKSDDASDAVYVTILIEKFLSDLEGLKENNGLKNTTKFYDINKAIIEHFNKVENEFENVTLTEGIQSNNTLLDPNVYWQPSIITRRIYGGESVKIEKFPFMASIQFFKKFQCGGSIIKSDLVITSASCLQLAWNNRFYRENPAFLTVQVGSTYYDYGGENIPVMEIYFYPNYNPKNLRHNLAIMRLMRALLFGKEFKRVKKIDFDRFPMPLASNAESITVVGWGAQMMSNINENSRKNRLSYSILQFYPLKECQEIYSKEYVTNTNFCAGFFSKGGGACNKDAGGPGISKGILMGVISFGSPVCGATDAPTVFTKLGFYTDWIEEIMEKESAQGFIETTKLQRGIPTMNIPPTLHPKPPTKWITPINTPDPSDIHKATTLVPVQEFDLRGREKPDQFKGFITTIFHSSEESDDKENIIKNDIKKPIKHPPLNELLRSKVRKKTRNQNKEKFKHRKKTKIRAITTTPTYDSSDYYTDEEDEVTNDNIQDKPTNSVNEQAMKKTIRISAMTNDNANSNDVIDESSDSSSETKERSNLKRIVETNPALLPSKLYLADIVNKEIRKQRTEKQGANDKSDSSSDGSSESSYSDYSSSSKDSNSKDDESENKNNSNDKAEDGSGNDSYSDSISSEDEKPAYKPNKKISLNSTRKLLKMLADTDNIYDLFSKV